MVGNEKGHLVSCHMRDYVLFDLETTGISCNYDAIIEISAVKVEKGIVIDEFSQLVNPGRMIPSAASAVNHITDDMVADAPAFEEVLPLFDRFIGNEVLVGHNIHSFDMKFLWRDYEAICGHQLSNDYVDTLRLARMLLPQLRHHRLGDLAEYYGISSAGAHRALTDCRMNQKVYECLLQEKGAAKAEEKCAKVCPRCGAPLQLRNGRFGRFFGCQGYPGCRYTENA